MDIDGSWPGSPAWIGLKRFSGTLDASLNKGQFVEVDGSAQVLEHYLACSTSTHHWPPSAPGLLRPVRQGLSYDRVKGVLNARSGVYSTGKPILMTGHDPTNLELNGTLNMNHRPGRRQLLVTLP